LALAFKNLAEVYKKENDVQYTTTKLRFVSSSFDDSEGYNALFKNVVFNDHFKIESLYFEDEGIPVFYYFIILKERF
jgi:hypothetical protein